MRQRIRKRISWKKKLTRVTEMRTLVMEATHSGGALEFEMARKKETACKYKMYMMPI
jgi:hypothetical protein